MRRSLFVSRPDALITSCTRSSSRGEKSQLLVRGQKRLHAGVVAGQHGGVHSVEDAQIGLRESGMASKLLIRHGIDNMIHLATSQGISISIVFGGIKEIIQATFLRYSLMGRFQMITVLSQ
jgi:hypothetical protein